MDSELSILIFSASVSERAERYEEMVKVINESIDLAFNNKLSLGQKGHSLFSVAYKNMAGTKRASWRVLCAEKAKYEKGNPLYLEIVEEKIKFVKKELCDICTDALKIIDDKLLRMEEVKNNKESMVFYLKMKGDYFRYKAEVEEGEELENSSNLAKQSYDLATEQAMCLPSTAPIRLGLALNFSVFYYEILQKTDVACQIAKSTFDNAIADLDKLSEEHYKDSTLIMQLIRDNLTLWTSQPEQNLETGFERSLEEQNNEDNFN